MALPTVESGRPTQDDVAPVIDSSNRYRMEIPGIPGDFLGELQERLATRFPSMSRFIFEPAALDRGIYSPARLTPESGFDKITDSFLLVDDQLTELKVVEGGVTELQRYSEVQLRCRICLC